MMQTPTSRRNSILALLAIALPIVAAAIFESWGVLSHSGLPAAWSIAHHTDYARGFIEGIREGALYPRWIAGINRGLGGPVFVFYGPLIYAVIGAVNLVTRDLVLAIRVTMFLGALGAGTSMFFFAKSFTSSRWASIAAAAFLLMPYPTFDVQYRFALAEFLTVGWIPLILLSVRRLIQSPDRKRWIFFALAYAGLVMTHIVTAFLALFVVGPYALGLMALERTWKRSLPAIISAGFVAAMCAGVYLVPALVERPLVHMDAFITVTQRSWDNSMLFGPPYELRIWRHRGHFQLEALALAQTGVLLTAAFLAFLRWRTRKSERSITDMWLMAAVGLWSLFLTTRLAIPIWRAVPQLQVVQFPYRFLTFNAALSSVIIAFIGANHVRSTKADTRKRTRSPRLATAAIASVLALSLIPAAVSGMILQRRGHYTFTSQTAEKPSVKMKIVEEYVPMTIPDFRSIRDFPVDTPRVRIEPDGDATVERWDAQRRTVTTSSKTEARLTVRTFNYPGWRATLDGRSVPIETSTDFGQIEIPVPPGEHRIDLRFGSTPDRRAGVAASVVGLFIVALVAGSLWKRNDANEAPA